MKRSSFVFGLPLLVACQPAGALDDPGFDLWCGKSLCKWETEQGSIRRVPTWNEEDFGVELVGKPVVLSQLASGRGRCLEFSILGNVQKEAEVRLELDFFDDDTVDFTESIPGIRWNQLDLLVRLPEQPYDSLRVALRKQANGTAVFARLAANPSDECDGDPIVLAGLGLGYSCSQNADCMSDVCSSIALGENPDCTNILCIPPSGGLQTCGKCATNDACGSGLVCGALPAEQSRGSYRACIPPHTSTDGSVCFSDDECVHAHCVNGVCDECKTDQDCGGDLACGKAKFLTNGAHWACVPPGSLQSGDLCFSSRACANDNCAPSAHPGINACGFPEP